MRPFVVLGFDYAAGEGRGVSAGEAGDDGVTTDHPRKGRRRGVPADRVGARVEMRTRNPPALGSSPTRPTLLPAKDRLYQGFHPDSSSAFVGQAEAEIVCWPERKAIREQGCRSGFFGWLSRLVCSAATMHVHPVAAPKVV
ncbi:hypothetical protein GCM10010400_51570 [Streptomyces aculeolatus]